MAKEAYLDHYVEQSFLFEHLMRCYKHVLRPERPLLMVPVHGQNGLVCRQLEKEFSNLPPAPPIPNGLTYHPGTYKLCLSTDMSTEDPPTGWWGVVAHVPVAGAMLAHEGAEAHFVYYRFALA